jgi:hypothetical protein
MGYPRRSPTNITRPFARKPLHYELAPNVHKRGDVHLEIYVCGGTTFL